MIFYKTYSGHLRDPRDFQDFQNFQDPQGAAIDDAEVVTILHGISNRLGCYIIPLNDKHKEYI